MAEQIQKENFYKKLFGLALPIALQSLMLSAVSAGDAVMLGSLDQNSMSAVSLASQVQFVQNMALTAITGSAVAMGAQYWGKGDKQTISEIFCMILRVAGLISLAFGAACLTIPQMLMKIFTDEAELIEIGAGYLRIAGWTYILTGISQSYLAIMKVTGHVSRSAWISSGAVVLNLILNAIFIFGLFGVPAMGAKGAALATLLARVIELGWAVISSYQKNFMPLNFKKLFYHDKQLMKDYYKLMMPVMGSGMLWGIGFTMYTAIIGHMGADATAANSIAGVVRDLTSSMCNGLASGGGIVVGNELGAGKLDQGKLYGTRLMKISYILGLICTVIVLAVSPFVVNFMSLTDNARSLLKGMMIILSIYMIGRCVTTIVITGVFAAGGDTIFNVYSLAITMWCIALPLAALGAFVFHWPVLAVYSCTCLDEVGKLPWVMIHFRKYKWVRDITRER